MDADPTSALLRQHIESFVGLFRTATDPNVLLTALTNVTNVVIRNGPNGGFGLRQKLNALPFPKVVGSVRFTQPWSRTPQFDESIEALIQALFSASDEIAAFERRFEANRLLEINQVRNLVLREVVDLDRQRLGDAVWLYDLEWNLGLSRYQAYDAVDFWHREGLLESIERPAAAANYPWRFLLSPYGRADSIQRLAAQPKAVEMTWLEIHNYGPVGIQTNAPGSIVNVGSILQVNRAVITSGLSEIRAILNELPPDQREEVQSYLETIEDELKAATPREGRIKHAFTAIRRAVAAVAKPAISAVVEGAVSGAVKGLSGSS